MSRPRARIAVAASARRDFSRWIMVKILPSWSHVRYGRRRDAIKYPRHRAGRDNMGQEILPNEAGGGGRAGPPRLGYDVHGAGGSAGGRARDHAHIPVVGER